VSHDREFVGGLATRIIELRPGGIITDFRGTYDEYLKGQGLEYSVSRRHAIIGTESAFLHRQNGEISRMARWLSIAILVGLTAQAESPDAPVGGKAFVDRRNPPSYRLLDEAEAAQVSLGRSVFDTQWAPAGTPDVGGRVGVGPLYNATSCNACHHEGEGGRGSDGDGAAPASLVIQLGSSAGAEPNGDPVYGSILSTSALQGVRVEGAVMIQYDETAGYYYPFGGRWSLRVPHYHLVGLSRGPLAPTTVIKPRLAPALFGVGLLEAVPESAITEATAPRADGRYSGAPVWRSFQGKRLPGRLGGRAARYRSATRRPRRLRAKWA